ncbi:MAG: hypothetical protein IJ367_01240, partial [Clostridia bacterium]|nr:hypothetical protein [Clostridia bacterium]
MLKKIFTWLLTLSLVVSMSVFAADSAPSEESELEAEARLRKSGVVFLHIGNYATVSDGTLKWIDPANKSVKPYIKEGRT